MKKCTERFYYRGVSGGDEVLECLVLNELELTAKEIVKWEAVSKKMRSFDEAQGKRTAEL